jgi:hypothetical protein
MLMLATRERTDRRDAAERLVSLHIKHAPLFAEIDDLKEQLRQYAEVAAQETVADIKERLRDLRKLELTIDALKEKLCELGAPSYEGFTERFEGKGFVQVSAGSKRRFKGIVPVLNVPPFLDLPDKRRDLLIADSIVMMEKQFTQASRPSVTVKL